MRADHPGSYLHLSQPMRLDARPCTYMWPRKQHDAVPGDAAKWVPPSKSEWTRSADGVPFRVLRDERASATRLSTPRGRFTDASRRPASANAPYGFLSGSPRLMSEANLASPHIKKPVSPGPCDYIAYATLQHFEHGVGGGKSYGPPVVHAGPARSPKECRVTTRLGSRRLSDGSLSAASTTFRPSTPTTSTMKK